MKLFYKTISLSIFYNLLVGLFALAIDKSFLNFQERIVVFTILFFSIQAFGYSLFKNGLNSFPNSKFKFFISICSVCFLTFIFSFLTQKLYFNEINLNVLFYQNILALLIFIFQLLIFNFINSFQKLNSINFNQKTVFHLKLIFGLTCFQFIILFLFFYQDYNDLSSHNFPIFYIIKSFIFFPLVINFSTFYLFKFSYNFELFKKNTLFILILINCFNTLITLIWYPKNGLSKVFFITSIFTSFSFLVYYFFISNYKKHQKSKSIISNLSNKNFKNELEYQQLKQEANPHFLFNNLNVLISLIDLNPKKAIDFGHSLSAIYRHNLEQQKEDFIDLNSELSFIESYLQLFSTKFENTFSYTIDKVFDRFYILSFSLQELIDNIFKHTILDEDHPILISIEMDSNFLIVKNTKNRVQEKFKSETGLQNINKRYQILIEKSIEIQDSENFFSVKLPLIKS